MDNDLLKDVPLNDRLINQNNILEYYIKHFLPSTGKFMCVYASIDFDISHPELIDFRFIAKGETEIKQLLQPITFYGTEKECGEIIIKRNFFEGYAWCARLFSNAIFSALCDVYAYESVELMDLNRLPTVSAYKPNRLIRLNVEDDCLDLDQFLDFHDDFGPHYYGEALDCFIIYPYETIGALAARHLNWYVNQRWFDIYHMPHVKNVFDCLPDDVKSSTEMKAFQAKLFTKMNKRM